jgi:transketolase
MAMAARYERGLLDPDAAQAQSIFDHRIWVICSDGDLQEGVSAEASSLAGTQKLGNLKVIYDDNRISIEGDTHVAFDENVTKRYESYGWKVFEVAAKSDGDVDRESLEDAMIKAASENKQPVLIRLHSVIAWPAPKAKGTAESHGSALGADEVAATKKILGVNPDASFEVSEEVLQHSRKVKDRGNQIYTKWHADFVKWQSENPMQAQLLQRISDEKLPIDWSKELPVFGVEKEIATRAASGKVIQSIAKALPEFWGGSADLAGSNNTTIEGGKSFLPLESNMENADPYGRIIHFGIREHAMGAILNGIALHGIAKPFAGTFLVFSDYMRGAVRLSALMNLPVTYVWSHDSIGLGEDGPTHQPVEHLAALRAIPNFAVVRPADANEVAIAWREIIERAKPVGLALSRQNLPVFDRSKYASAEGVSKGAYVMLDTATDYSVILIATGSELSLAAKAQEKLLAEGIHSRLVSAPSLEWFEEQDQSYKEQILPKRIKARVSIEAGIAMPWHKFIGDAGVAVSLEHFGASASAPVLFNEFGFNVDNVVVAAKESIAKSK